MQSGLRRIGFGTCVSKDASERPGAIRHWATSNGGRRAPDGVRWHRLNHDSWRQRRSHRRGHASASGENPFSPSSAPALPAARAAEPGPSRWPARRASGLRRPAGRFSPLARDKRRSPGPPGTLADPGPGVEKGYSGHAAGAYRASFLPRSRIAAISVVSGSPASRVIVNFDFWYVSRFSSNGLFESPRLRVFSRSVKL